MAETVAVSVTVNGTAQSSDVEPRLLLVHYLRDTLGLTGTHVGCDTSNCGACTVLVDGVSVKSCTVLAVQADGAEVTTIEGMASGTELHPLQEGFWAEHGLQCGYCTPGMIMAAADLLQRNPDPSEEEIRHGIAGNLCRCTGYHNIVKAIQHAARAAGGRRGARARRVRAGRARREGGGRMSGQAQRRQRPHRTPDAPQGGPAAHPGQGPLRRRHHRARRPVGELRALPRGARHDRLDRRLGRARAPGGRRGLHRGGPRPRGPAAAGLGAARRDRQHAGALAARQGHGQPRRRRGRRGHRPRPVRGRGRGRGRHRGVRPAAGRRRPGGGAQGRGARPREPRHEQGARVVARRRRRERAGRRRGRGRAPLRQPPDLRRADRAARRARRLPRGRAHAHDLHADPALPAPLRRPPARHDRGPACA